MDPIMSDSYEGNHYGNNSMNSASSSSGSTGALTDSVGPDEMGASIIKTELESIPWEGHVEPYKRHEKVPDVREVLNLDKLLFNIKRCGFYRYIIVNATADKADLQIKSQNVLFDVLKLCDAVSLIVQNFQQGSNNIMEKIKIAYLYLLDGFPDFALADIEATSKDLAAMRLKCEKTLEKMPGDECVSMDRMSEVDRDESFKELPDNFTLNAMHESITEIEGEEGVLNELGIQSEKEKDCHMQGMVRQLEHRIAGQTEENLQGDIDSEFLKVTLDGGDESYIYVDKEQVRAMIEADTDRTRQTSIYYVLRTNSWTSWGIQYIVSIYLYFFGLPSTAVDDGPTSVAASSNSSVLNPEAIAMVDSYMRAKLTSELIAIVKEHYKEIRNVIQTALEHAEIWYQESKTLVEPVTKTNIEKAANLTSEQQKKFWSTFDKDFERKSAQYINRWADLQTHCQEYRKEIHKVRATVENYYIENPYPREAIKNAWKLASEAGTSEPRISKILRERNDYVGQGEK